MVDTLALGASASGREGSSPFSRTILELETLLRLFSSVLDRFGPSRTAFQETDTFQLVELDIL